MIRWLQWFQSGPQSIHHLKNRYVKNWGWRYKLYIGSQKAASTAEQLGINCSFGESALHGIPRPGFDLIISRPDPYDPNPTETEMVPVPPSLTQSSTVNDGPIISIDHDAPPAVKISNLLDDDGDIDYDYLTYGRPGGPMSRPPWKEILAGPEADASNQFKTRRTRRPSASNDGHNNGMGNGGKNENFRLHQPRLPSWPGIGTPAQLTYDDGYASTKGGGKLS